MKYKRFWMIIIIAGIALLGSTCFKPPAAASAGIEIIANDQGYLFSEKGENILFYQKAIKTLNGNYPRCDYVHPLYGLDGEVLTEDFPEDHIHHHGIFWAWHQVLIGDKAIGDAWLDKDFRWEIQNTEILKTNRDTATLKAQVLWLSPLWLDSLGNEKPFVREEVYITVHSREENFRLIDFEMGLYALEPELRIGGSNDEKGYGGFSPRFLLPADTKFFGEGGPVTPQNTAVEAGPWVDVSGTYSEGRVAGITILCHTSNPNYPQPWILRQAKSMQNAVYPGRTPVPLPQDNPLVLRYRLIVHRGDAAAIPIQKLHQEYCSIKKFLIE